MKLKDLIEQWAGETEIKTSSNAPALLKNKAKKLQNKPLIQPKKKTLFKGISQDPEKPQVG